MDVYKLSFNNADGGVIPLPGNFNKHSTVEDLRAFATTHGHDPAKWGETHAETLSGFFKHAALTRIDDPEYAQRLSVDPFLRAVQEETGLFPLPSQVFEDRFRKGALKGIFDGNDRLVATINVLPKLGQGIKEHLNIENHPDDPQVYEAGAGWAARSHRGLGLYTLHRRAVMDSEGASGKLVFSQNYGKGASSVNRREGWTLLNWREFPFAGALMAWPKDTEGLMGGKIQQSSGLVLDMPENGLYTGDTISFCPDERGALTEQARVFTETHDWTKSHHLWANDYGKLQRFERHLRSELEIPEDQHPDPKVVAFAYKNWLKAIKKHSFVVNREDKTNGDGWSEFGTHHDDVPAPAATGFG